MQSLWAQSPVSPQESLSAVTPTLFSMPLGQLMGVVACELQQGDTVSLAIHPE